MSFWNAPILPSSCHCTALDDTAPECLVCQEPHICHQVQDDPSRTLTSKAFLAQVRTIAGGLAMLRCASWESTTL